MRVGEVGHVDPLIVVGGDEDQLPALTASVLVVVAWSIAQSCEDGGGVTQQQSPLGRGRQIQSDVVASAAMAGT
jgi:hypothetical protein